MRRQVIPVKYPTDNPAPNKTTFVFGQTGTGKTVLVSNLAMLENRFFILDTEGNFTNLGEHVTVCTSPSEVISALNVGKKRIVYRINPEEKTCRMAMDFCVLTLFRFQEANPQLGEVCFVVDEIARFATNVNSFPNGLANVIQRGRFFHITKIIGGQWFNRVPPFMRDSFSDFYLFRQIDQRALDSVAFFGFDVEQVKSLPDLNCFCLSHGEFTHIILSPSGTFSGSQKQKAYFAA